MNYKIRKVFLLIIENQIHSSKQKSRSLSEYSTIWGCFSLKTVFRSNTSAMSSKSASVLSFIMNKCCSWLKTYLCENMKQIWSTTNRARIFSGVERDNTVLSSRGSMAVAILIMWCFVLLGFEKSLCVTIVCFWTLCLGVSYSK